MEKKPNHGIVIHPNKDLPRDAVAHVPTRVHHYVKDLLHAAQALQEQGRGPGITLEVDLEFEEALFSTPASEIGDIAGNLLLDGRRAIQVLWGYRVSWDHERTALCPAPESK